MTYLILVSGLPGSGKSTLAEDIAQKLCLPIFSVDPIESAMIKSGIERSFETGLAAYLVAETLASEQLSLGLSVIIDAVSSVREARDMWRNLSAKHNSRLIVIECVLDSALHMERIANRVRNLSGIAEVTWADVENRRLEYLKWQEERLVIDTADSQENNLAIALAYIQARQQELG